MLLLPSDINILFNRNQRKEGIITPTFPELTQCMKHLKKKKTIYVR